LHYELAEALDCDLLRHVGSGGSLGASEKAEDEAIRFSTTARRQTADWSGLPCKGRFWDWKLGPAKAYCL
jgi:hypothetical protein